jgi:hypothetical protein
MHEPLKNAIQSTWPNILRAKRCPHNTAIRSRRMRTSVFGNDRLLPWLQNRHNEPKAKIHEFTEGTEPTTAYQIRRSNGFTARTVGTALEGTLTLG